jgi:hypothetical protein
VSAGQRLHELKTWPDQFAAVVDGSKPYEVRLDDRGFAVGDLVRLAEWDPADERYTRRETTRRVTHVLEAGTFGLRPGYVVLGLASTDGVSLTGGPLDEAVQALHARLSETRAYLRGYESSLLPHHDDCCRRHERWAAARRAERDSLREREQNILAALQALDPVAEVADTAASAS